MIFQNGTRNKHASNLENIARPMDTQGIWCTKCKTRNLDRAVPEEGLVGGIGRIKLVTNWARPKHAWACYPQNQNVAPYRLLLHHSFY